MTEWQPIETAPKDGRMVVVLGKSDGLETHRIACAFWFQWEVGDWYYSPQNIDEDFEGCRSLDFIPTHWMPLPEPPEGELVMTRTLNDKLDDLDHARRADIEAEADRLHNALHTSKDEE